MEYNLALIRPLNTVEFGISEHPSYEEGVKALARPILPGNLPIRANDLFILEIGAKGTEPLAFSFAESPRKVHVYSSDRAKDVHFRKLPAVSTFCRRALIEDSFLNDMRFAWNTAWLEYHDVAMNMIKLLYELGASQRRMSKLIYDCIVATTHKAYYEDHEKEKANEVERINQGTLKAIDIFDQFLSGKKTAMSALRAVRLIKGFASPLTVGIENCLIMNRDIYPRNHSASIAFEVVRTNLLTSRKYRSKPLSRNDHDELNEKECSLIRKFFPLTELMDRIARY